MFVKSQSSSNFVFAHVYGLFVDVFVNVDHQGGRVESVAIWNIIPTEI